MWFLAALIFGPPLLVGLCIWGLYRWSLSLFPVTDAFKSPDPVAYNFEGHKEFLEDFNNLYTKTEAGVNRNSKEWKDRIARRALGQGAKTLHAHAIELRQKCQVAFDDWEQKYSGLQEGHPYYPPWTWSWEMMDMRVKTLDAICKKDCSKAFIKEFDLKAELRSLRHRTAGYLWACRTNRAPNYDAAILYVNFKPSLSTPNRRSYPTQGQHKSHPPYVHTPYVPKSAIEIRREKLLQFRAKPSIDAVQPV